MFSGSAAVKTGRTVYKKSLTKISDSLKPRTDLEIYEALFGNSPSDCVEILHRQDQVLPKIDGAIYIHFKTCPEELSRILSQFEYKEEIINVVRTTARTDWRDHESLGDKLTKYEYVIQEGRNIRTLWVTLNGEEVLCRDIFD